MTTSAPPARQAGFGFIFALALMNSISFGIMIPILPNLVRQMTGGDTASAADWNVVFATSWGVMQFFCGPLLGMFSDRFGRRPVLLLSLLGLGIDFLFMAFAPTLWWLLVGRILNGATAASFSTANAYLADVTPPERRAKMFGLMGSAFSFGFIIGPTIGGILGEYSLRLPFVAAAFDTVQENGCSVRTYTTYTYPTPFNNLGGCSTQVSPRDSVVEHEGDTEEPVSPDVRGVSGVVCDRGGLREVSGVDSVA